MKSLILFLLLILPQIMPGQETKRIIDTRNNETYYVLKSNKKIRNGVYYRFSDDKKLVVKGFYKQGLKDSLWEFYDQDGQLNLKYDYQINDLIMSKPSFIAEFSDYRIVDKRGCGDSATKKSPIFIGGQYAFTFAIAANLHYPSQAAERGASGKVNVVFTVDKYGRTSNYHVKTPVGFGMDEESIRILELFSDNWLPGRYCGQAATVELVIPISFIIK